MWKTRYSKDNNATMYGGAIEEKESHDDDKIEIKRYYSCIYENDHYSLEIMDEFNDSALTTTGG
jgi:hypothetical protein